MTELKIASTGQSDADIARDLRERARAALTEVTKVLDDANRANMRVQFQIGVDGFGRNVVASIDIVKVL